MARSDRDSALGGHRLNVDKPSDTVPPLASSETGVLHPAHRRVDAAEGGGKALIDVHGATFDLACHAASAIMVGGPHTRVETIVGVVGSCHRVLLGGYGIDADDRTEGLLGVAVHLPRDIGQDGRLVEQIPEIFAPPATRQNRGTLRPRVLDSGRYVFGEELERFASRIASVRATKARTNGWKTASATYIRSVDTQS